MWPAEAPRRGGFTVLELLIAASLSALLVGLAIQGTYEYFRLKQALLVRTELRHAVEAAKAVVQERLRQALELVPLSQERYVLVLGQDVDRCGYLCDKDRYELLRWEVVPEVSKPDSSFLREVRVVTPAFRLPATQEELEPLFAKAVGKGRRLVSGVEALRIEPEQGRLHRVRITMQRMGLGGVPVKLTHQDFMTLRARPRSVDLMTVGQLTAAEGDRPEHGDTGTGGEVP